MTGRSQLEQRIDYRVLVLFCLVSVGLLLPYVMLYGLAGDRLSAAWIACLASIYGAAALCISRARQVRPWNVLLAAVATVGTVVPVYFIGAVAAMWVFPLILVNFYMLNRYQAVLTNGGAILVTVLLLWSTLPGMTLINGLAAAAAVMAFSYAFAWGVDTRQQELLELARRDPLTGLGNRRALDGEVNALGVREAADRPALSIIVCDLDRFKQINDRYGHGRGDEVIRAAAELIRGYFRSADQVFRYGGEEFVIICHGAALQDATRLAEGLRRRVAEKLRFDELRVTVSIGVATMGEGESAAACLERADRQLFRAKAGGRDRVSVALPVAAGA